MRMYCRRCYEPHDGWVPPKTCPACAKPTTALDWLINLPQDRPQSAWELTEWDKTLLAKHKIAQD